MWSKTVQCVLKCAPPMHSTKKTTMHCVVARGGMKPCDESGGDTAEEKREPRVRKKSQADVAGSPRNQGAGVKTRWVADLRSQRALTWGHTTSHLGPGVGGTLPGRFRQANPAATSVSASHLPSSAVQTPNALQVNGLNCEQRF